MLSHVERLDLESGTWEEMPPLLCAREGCAVAELDGVIYVVGGYDGTTHLHSVERFDPMASKWEEVDPMNSSRMGCGAAALDGALYVAGGFSVSDAPDAVGARMGSVR